MVLRYPMPKKKRSKHNSVKTEVDGMLFDSKAEADYYVLLTLLVKAKKVSHFLRQVPFDLPGKTKYRLDFLVFYNSELKGGDMGIEYIDVKGQVTAMFKMKKRQVEALYPVKIKCVKRVNRHTFTEIEV